LFPKGIALARFQLRPLTVGLRKLQVRGLSLSIRKLLIKKRPRITGRFISWRFLALMIKCYLLSRFGGIATPGGVHSAALV
jgi:hypothetical protein